MPAPVDLRSDLHARPTEEMWAAMRDAELGWATYGEDASVNALQERVAALLGHEAGLWVPTCGMANLVAMMTLARPGRAVVLESQSHVLTSEGMGISDVAGLDPHSLWAADGRLDPADVSDLMGETGARLLVLENTHTRAGGTTLSPERTAELAEVALRHGAYVHLDGARLPNAAVALGVAPEELARPADTVAFSLNKAVGAPFGTILAGGGLAIDRARANLRRIGGASVHKAGLAAAAALVGLEGLEGRIAEDHRRARELGALLAELPGLRLDPETIETNIVLVDAGGTGFAPDELLRLLAAEGVLGMERDTSRIRFVTHRGIGDAEVARAAEAMARVLAEQAPEV